MATIVTYTDLKPPKNDYPRRIISPCRSGACCFSDMEEIGSARREGEWVLQYRRCRKCGFAVRVVLRQIPDTALAEELRAILATAFNRKDPGL